MAKTVRGATFTRGSMALFFEVYHEDPNFKEEGINHLSARQEVSTVIKHGKITKRPTNFSWIIDGKLAGTGRPMTRDEFDWLVEQGIGSVITMTEEPLEKSWVTGIDWLHLPTPDLNPPSSESMDKAVDFIHKRILDAPRNSVAVHCQAGLGR